MDAQEFRQDFMEDVKAEAAASGEGSCASFVSSFAQYLQEAEYLMDFNASYYEGTGKRSRKFRVDGYAYDEFDKTMSLIIADFNASDQERILTKTQAESLLGRLIYFIYQSLNTNLYYEVEMSRSVSDLIDFLREKRNEIRKYQLLIFTTANVGVTITKLESADIDGKNSECQIWDIDRLFKVCGSDTGRQIIEIDFKSYSMHGIPCLEAYDADTENFHSYLCIIPGIAIADIYDHYGSALLEGNVRSFLSTKVAVNKKIRATILQCPERFFAYNNGISATALDVQIESTPQGHFLVSARDFQIINGGQTTASLSNARYKDKADLSAIYVQMKLTVIKKTLEEEATELVQNISRSSNSQNKVSDADFFSTHPFHVRMERFSQRLFARAVGGMQYDTRWFYERTRGQYLQKQMRLTPSEKKKFLLQNPKSQLITKTDLAKVRNTWNGYPYTVSRGAQTNFMAFAEATGKEWDDTDEGLIFNEKYFQETVALVLVFRYTEKMVGGQSWFTTGSGYRANIVTYTIALLHKLIQAQYSKKDLDLMGIWSRQAVPEAVADALAHLSKLVYENLTAPGRPVENVTQWCKREACWNSVQTISYDFPTSIESCLVRQEDQRTAEREARADQKLVSGIDIQAKICTEITPVQWQKAMRFAMEKRMITPEELTSLRIATQIPAKLPTPFQCKRLITVLERLQEEGFKL